VIIAVLIIIGAIGRAYYDNASPISMPSPTPMPIPTPYGWHRNTEYMITNQRIITQTGAIGLDTRYLDLDKIQEVYVEVGFIDKTFEKVP